MKPMALLGIWIKPRDSMPLNSIISKDGSAVRGIEASLFANPMALLKEVTVVMMSLWGISKEASIFSPIQNPVRQPAV